MGPELVLVGAVRGLAVEGERVAALIGEHGPALVGISVSKEGLEAMRSAEYSEGLAVNIEEKVYIRGLSRYGKVVKPPPCFMSAYQSAGRLNIDLVAIDMDEEHYTASYCKCVNTWDMMRQGRRDREMAKYKFHAKTAKEFVVEWDKLVNKLPGYRALEISRERWLAKRIHKIASSVEKTLFVIEYERLAGVAKYLKQQGVEYIIAL